MATPTVQSLVEELGDLTAYDGVPAGGEIVEEATSYVHNQQDDRKGLVIPVADGKDVVRRIIVELADGFDNRAGSLNEYVRDVTVDAGGDGISTQGPYQLRVRHLYGLMLEAVYGSESRRWWRLWRQVPALHLVVANCCRLRRDLLRAHAWYLLPDLSESDRPQRRVTG